MRAHVSRQPGSWLTWDVGPKMIIAPDNVDTYLRAKGIEPRMSDVEWSSTIGVLAQFFKEGRGFRVKLLHQKEDALRRFSCSFPESVPQPYRFIDYIQFGASVPSEIVSILTSHAIPFHVKTEKNGPEEDDVVSVIYVGPKE